MRSAVEDTFSHEYLMCPYLEFGCHWFSKFLPADRVKASRQRDVHRLICTYRFHAPPR